MRCEKIERDRIRVDSVYRQVLMYEYDMKMANVSLCGYYNLLPAGRIEELQNLSSNERKIKFGLLCRKDNELNSAVSNAFRLGRRLFAEANNITDEEIVAVKKDAIITTKKCNNTVFTNDNGRELKFICKHKYTTIMQLNKGIDLYAYYDELHDTIKLDVDGIDNKTLPIHEDGILKFLKHVIILIETDQKVSLLRYIKDMYDKYRKRELPLVYYRTFDPSSTIQTNDLDDWGIVDEHDLDRVNINYNIEHVFLPLLNTLLQIK